MGIGRTNAVAGGASLNFTVVDGTAEPANPKENMNWVNTDQEITGWHFSAEEPVNREKIESQSSINNSLSRYGSALLIDADLQPDTTYTLSFNGAEGNKYYLNENITTLEVITVTAEKVEVTFKTNSTLSKTNSSAYNSSKNAWIILKNNIDQTNSHVFDNVQIEEHFEGTIWFGSGTSSDVAFNALRKNAIFVYPQFAKQFINGAWEEKTAKTYQNGKWVEWWNGDFVFNRKKQTFDEIKANLRECYDNTGYIYAEDAEPYVKLTTKSGNAIPRTMQWKVPIDFTNYTTLELVGYATSAECFFGVSDSLKSTSVNYVDIATHGKKVFSTARDTLVLPLDGMNKTGYIGFYLNASGSAWIESIRLK